jgi:hypothetical protein
LSINAALMASIGVGGRTAGGLAALDVTDGLAHAAAEVVIDHRARIGAQPGAIRAALEMIAVNGLTISQRGRPQRGHRAAEVTRPMTAPNDE